MNKTSRKPYDLTVDEATSHDTINDADMATAHIVYPGKKISFKIDVDKETYELCKKIADKKHIISFSQLVDQYIKEGVARDKALIS